MRFRVIQICLFLSLFLVLLRLGYWQILQKDILTAKAEKQRISSKTILAPRGEIRFADGSPLASSQSVYLVFAQPKIIKDKESISKQIAQIFFEEDSHKFNLLDEEGKDEELKKIQLGILEKLSKDLYWVSLGRKVPAETKLKIEKLNIKGIGFDTFLTRFYPEGSSSAHLLGFVGADAYGADTGYFGLEGYYDGELRGKEGLLVQDKDAQGLPILIGTYSVKPPRPGKTLTLNIDRTIQNLVEDRLKRDFEKFGAKGASAIVMDPKTGNILALAAFPNYDPLNPGLYPKVYYKNPLTADGYEPGSTFKVLVMAAAIEEQLITSDTVCNTCTGPVNLGGYVIRTWNNQYRLSLTMTDTIIHSDNTGMVFAANKLGINKMYDYIQKFGFGETTGVDLQDERSPWMRPKKEWKEIDLATASFGQGISVSALQMIRAISAIANGGVIMEPHVVKSIKDDQATYTISPREIAHPISSKTAMVVKEMMVKAVDQGEAKFYKPVGFKIAGKTGTAQIPVAGHYDPSKTIASFVGFAPADDPKFIILVRYDQPTSSIYGAETAAPTFFAIAKELFTYLNIFPQE